MSKDTKGIILVWAGLFVIIYLIYSGFTFVSGYFSEKSDRESYCQTHTSVRNANTDFAAEKAFKKCMNR